MTDTPPHELVLLNCDPTPWAYINSILPRVIAPINDRLSLSKIFSSAQVP